MLALKNAYTSLPALFLTDVLGVFQQIKSISLQIQVRSSQIKGKSFEIVVIAPKCRSLLTIGLNLLSARAP
jgi:hypothetical protein